MAGAALRTNKSAKANWFIKDTAVRQLTLGPLASSTSLGCMSSFGFLAASAVAIPVVAVMLGLASSMAQSPGKAGYPQQLGQELAQHAAHPLVAVDGRMHVTTTMVCHWRPIIRARRAPVLP